MTLAHHDASHRHQRCRANAELLGPHHGGHDDVTSRAEATIRPQHNTMPQIVEGEYLVRFRQPHFPGDPRVLDG